MARAPAYEEALRGINAKAGFGISSHHEQQVTVALADGSRECLPDETPIEELRRLLERDDDKPIALPKN